MCNNDKLPLLKLVDFHTHTFLSDGAYGPMEMAQRARSKGYSIIGLTDHVDFGTCDVILPQLIKAAERINSSEMGITALAGVEITHVPPSQIQELVASCREKGAEYVIVHGETPSEPVMKGTNRAAIMASADILAHPGFISEEDVALAAEKGVFLELSGKPQHMTANRHILKLARKYRAPLLLNSDAHNDEQLFTPERYRKILEELELPYRELQEYIERFLKKILRRASWQKE